MHEKRPPPRRGQFRNAKAKRKGKTALATNGHELIESDCESFRAAIKCEQQKNKSHRAMKRNDTKRSDFLQVSMHTRFDFDSIRKHWRWLSVPRCGNRATHLLAPRNAIETKGKKNGKQKQLKQSRSGEKYSPVNLSNRPRGARWCGRACSSPVETLARSFFLS